MIFGDFGATEISCKTHTPSPWQQVAVYTHSAGSSIRTQSESCLRWPEQYKPNISSPFSCFWSPPTSKRYSAASLAAKCFTMLTSKSPPLSVSAGFIIFASRNNVDVCGCCGLKNQNNELKGAQGRWWVSSPVASIKCCHLTFLQSTDVFSVLTFLQYVSHHVHTCMFVTWLSNQEVELSDKADFNICNSETIFDEGPRHFHIASMTQEREFLLLFVLTKKQILWSPHICSLQKCTLPTFILASGWMICGFVTTSNSLYIYAHSDFDPLLRCGLQILSSKNESLKQQAYLCSNSTLSCRYQWITLSQVK